MRKFFVFHENNDCYVEAKTTTIEDGFLIFWDNDKRVAAFPPGKWDYFKEVSIENV